MQLSREVHYARITIVFAIVMSVVSGACNASLIVLITRSLNSANGPSREMIWEFLGLCLMLPVTRFISEFLLIRLTATAITFLRIKLCQRILAAPLTLLEQHGSHRLVALLTSDAPTIANTLVDIPLLCMNITLLIGCLIYLGWLSWMLLIGLLVLMALGILSYQIPLVTALGYYSRARELTDALYNHFNAVVFGTKELKLHRERREAFLAQHLETTAQAMLRQIVIGNTIHSAANSWGQVLFFIVIGLAFFVLPNQTETDKYLLTGYTLTLLYMMTPLQVLLNILPSLSQADVAMQKIESLGLSLNAQPPDYDANQTEKKDSWKALELKRVTHTYKREGEESDFTLGPIDLTLRPGELVFLIGGNGSGKTTLAKILTGLYPPDAGEILLDGKSITHENRDNYRQLFSVVYFDFYLFQDLLGLEGPQIDETAREYLLKLQLDRMVKVESGTLSKTDLSQGQRKRLALLTAYLENRPIYLFDEWAADQDPLFREFFYFELLPELAAKGKTVIVISHDDRYYHLADRIIKLDYGKLQYDRLADETMETASVSVAVN
jgi:putative ATP-binding cassette transporter